MEIKGIKFDYKFLKKYAVTMQTANVLLVFLLATSLFYNTQKDTIVINNANPSCYTMEMSVNRMGESSHIRMGYYMSSYLGNITPKNIQFIEDAVMPFIDPNIYRNVEEVLAFEMKAIIDDHVTYEFRAEYAFYENGKTFVTGKSIVTGANGNKKSKLRTFEYEFHVNNYTTTVKFINVYDDLPHDAKWREKAAHRKGK